MVLKNYTSCPLLTAVHYVLASIKQHVWDFKMVERKNSAHFARYVSGIFNNEEKMKR